MTNPINKQIMKLFNNKLSKDYLKRMIPLLLILLPCLTAVGKTESRVASHVDSLYVFRFIPGNDMFYIPWQGNDEKLRALCRIVDTHRADIEKGNLPVYVDSYCASMPTEKENLAIAFTRSNRVKSALITREGLKETNFVTGNYAHAHQIAGDLVIVTLRIPVEEAPAQPQVAQEPARRDEPKEPEPRPVTSVVVSDTKNDPGNDATVASEPSPALQPATGRTPYCFALRTNLLYDAFLLPTLGVEWRISPNAGIRLDGSFSYWGSSRGKVQKIWLLTPEARWYLLRDRRFYVGASASYGQYNIYKYPLGNLLKDDTGYQGNLWSAGLTVGYSLPLCHSLWLDFNLGLGYTHSGYDSFTLIDGKRYFKSRDKSKNFWGPTQAGISLVWRLKKS